MEQLNSRPPKTNPSSGREEDLNPGPQDYKSSALTTRPRRLVESLMLCFDVTAEEVYKPVSEELLKSIQFLRQPSKQQILSSGQALVHEDCRRVGQW